MKENRLLEELKKSFEEARRGNSEMFVAFTYSLRFDVYAVDYEIKLNLMKALEKCEADGDITYAALLEARIYFQQNNPGGAKVIHHFAKDTDIMVDREEVWMFHNFTR